MGAEVWRLAGGRCEWCNGKVPYGAEFCHIIKRDKNHRELDEAWNGACLCRTCHNKLDRSRARSFAKMAKTKPRLYQRIMADKRLREHFEGRLQRFLAKGFAITLLLFAFAQPVEAYTVKRGDSLWKIAKRHYGDGRKWRRIYIVNRTKIRRPNHIRPGMKLRIPDATKDVVPDGYEYWKTVNATVKAYCPCRRCCAGHHDGKTALGDRATNLDGVAVSFKAIPKRTMMKIPQAGWKEADDTGPQPRKMWKRKRYYIEIRMKSHRTALRWGVKKLKVKLYREVG
jgi:3D (Asp-Asp-Asp) domain-containing protein